MLVYSNSFAVKLDRKVLAKFRYLVKIMSFSRFHKNFKRDRFVLVWF